MKQYHAPQRKYATVRKRSGFTGSVLLAVAFLLGIVVAGGFLPPCEVQAAQTTTLPSIELSVPIYTAQEDDLLQQTETAIATELAAIRQVQGLSAVTVSNVLSKNALYIATAMLTETNATAASAKAQSISSQLTYITVTAAVYAEDYYCTQPALGAEYFCKMVLNHTNQANAILKSDIQVVGFALVRSEFAGKTVTCGVICSAKTPVTQTQSFIPTDILAKDTQAPTVESKKVYVAAGTTLTDAHIQGALTILDERGQTPTVTYDLTQVDTQTPGEKTLTVQVSDPAGNQTACTVSIQVAAPTLPMILSETLLLPEIDDDELWDLSKYVQASDQYGIASVQTSPMFLRPAEVTAGKMVSVTVTNVYGLTKTAELPVVIQPVAYKNAAQDAQGAGLSISTLTGENPRADGHLMLTCNLLEKAKYYFTVQYPNGVQSTVVRSRNTLVWNPVAAGETKVLVTIYTENGGVYQTSELNIMVADKQVFVYNTLVVSFTSESGFMMDHALQQMHKFEPGTTVLALKEAMTVAGNTGEITVSFKNAKGVDLADTDLVATGTVVAVLEDGAEKVSYTVLIYGDTNGDGKISSGDYVKIRQQLLKGGVLTEIFLAAADTNHDGKVSSGDYVRVRQFLLGRLEIVQE